jgi:hypothetical protein
MAKPPLIFLKTLLETAKNISAALTCWDANDL